MRFDAKCFVVLCGVALAACNPPTACDCGPLGATISMSERRAEAIGRIESTGPCDLVCVEEDECTRIRIDASGEGTCHVRIAFRDGAPPFDADIDFGFIEGDCCRGYYAMGERDLQVPPAPGDESGDGS